MKFTHDDFLNEFHLFRQFMCSKRSVDQKFDAWSKLLNVYFRCESTHVAVPDGEEATRQAAMEMLIVEFPLRLGFEEALKLQHHYNAGEIAAALGDTEALEIMFEAKPKVIDVGGPDDDRLMDGSE